MHRGNALACCIECSHHDCFLLYQNCHSPIISLIGFIGCKLTQKKSDKQTFRQKKSVCKKTHRVRH